MVELNGIVTHKILLVSSLESLLRKGDQYLSLWWKVNAISEFSGLVSVEWIDTRGSNYRLPVIFTIFPSKRTSTQTR